MESWRAVLDAVKANRTFKSENGHGYNGALEVAQTKAVEAWKADGYPMPGDTVTAMTDEQRKAEPHAGDMFRIKTDVTGLVEPEFAG